MKIGIICAVGMELEPFLPLIKNCITSTKAMLTFYEGQIGSTNVIATFCGVGKTNATIATQILIDTFDAQAIINSGTAGGMDTTLQIFDTVICTESVAHDVAEDVLTTISSWIPSIYFKSDKDLLSHAKQAAAELGREKHIFYGRMVTGDKFIEDEGRDSILSTFSPLTVDMETASVAHVCYVNNVPYIAVRTITDTANDTGTDNFIKNCPQASALSTDIVLRILKLISTQS